MSLAKYLDKRNQDRIKINSDDFSYKLKEYLSGFVIKYSPFVSEVKKHFINNHILEKNLDSINYPHSNSLMIAVNSKDFKSISKAHQDFYDWSENANNDLTKKINTDLVLYKANIQKETLSSSEADQIFDSIMCSFNLFLESVKSKIKKIDLKENIEINPIFNDNDLNEKKCFVNIGESSFFINEKFEIDEIKVEDCMVAEKIKKISESSKNILTLYFLQPIEKRNYFENLKKDLCLGIQNLLPSNIEFFKEERFEENMDLWKVKIEEKYILENKENYNFFNSNRFVKWIERINEE